MDDSGEKKVVKKEHALRVPHKKLTANDINQLGWENELYAMRHSQSKEGVYIRTIKDNCYFCNKKTINNIKNILIKICKRK